MAQSYDNPDNITYAFGLYVFTVALATFLKPPPRCNQAIVTDIHVNATVLFTAVTTPAYVRLGTPGVPAKFAELSLGVTAAGAAANLVSSQIFSDINLTRDAITQVSLAVVAPTGGTPAGTGYLNVILSWS